MSKPNCYDCKHRRPISWDAHSSCANMNCKVKWNAYWIQSGWFYHPFNFDPSWLEECDWFEAK